MNMHIDHELLSAYLDSEVSARERQLIESHLPACEACRQEFESLRYTASLVRALPLRAVPRPFYVTEAMVAPPAKGGSAGIWGWLRTLAPLGAAVAAMLVLFVLTRPVFFGGGASQTGAPQNVQPPVAVMATGEAPAEPTDSARQGDAAEEATPAMESAALPESAGDDAAGSAAADSATDTGGFTMTAPLVGVGGETESAEDSDITAMEPMTTVVVVSPEAGGTANAQTTGRDGTVVTPLTMNTVIIVTVILLVALAGLLLFLNRQRR